MNEIQTTTTNEFSAVEQSFDSLVASGDFEKAMELANGITSRLSEVDGVWREKKDAVKKIQKRLQRGKDREARWEAYDRRLANLKTHHTDYYEQMVNLVGRDADQQILQWDCAGDERYACQHIHESYWGDYEFCGMMSDNESDRDYHWLKLGHNEDRSFLDDYPRLMALKYSGQKAHAGGNKCGSGYETTIYRFGGEMLLDSGRVITKEAFCMRCFKWTCIHCGAPESDGKCGFCGV